MRKTFTLLILSFFISTIIYAGPVDAEKALEIATSFWNSNKTLKTSGELQLIPEAKMARAASRNTATANNAQYYIFSTTEKSGFVIISGDDRLTPIIGYSDNCNIDEMPPALAEWLNEYSCYVDEVRAGTAEPLLRSTTTTAGTTIAPMLKTSWNQSAPYNNLCPKIGTQTPPTGCTATAMAQVMKFHEWPASPKKAISWNNNITGKTETIDITKNVYDWENMLPHYRNGYTQAQADAVAQLMVDVGKAIQSSYALSGTGSNDVYAARGLVNIFDYSPEIKIIKRNEHTYDEFISIVRENLEAQQPIIHTGHGQSYGAGHAFVCDGIDEDNLLHIDWGWDGAYNGYFDIGSMAPGGSGIGGGQDRYNVGQSMIVNIRPRQTDEADRTGDPTVYIYEVVNAAQNDAIVESDTVDFYGGLAKFKTIVQFLNWSHSTIDMQFGFSIKNTDGTINKTTIYEDPVTIEKDNALGYYIEFNVNNSNTASKDYLQEGTYNVEIVYKNGENEPVKMRGENNRLLLEVGKSSAILSKAQPDIEVSGFEFRVTPTYPNDNMSFDVAFRNKNTNNATVVVVPIINRLSNNSVASSDTLFDKGEVINVFDNTDFLVTYPLGNVIKNAGDYNVSFAYELRNSYTNHDASVDKKNLKSISGYSETFTIQALSDEPMPTVTAITANNTVFGNSLYVSARLLNNSGASPYTGTVGIFTEKDEKKTLLVKREIDELAAGSSTVISYDSNSYIFSIETGTYEVYMCELVNDEWVKLPHSGNCNFTIQEPTKCLLYANSIININNGQAIEQGDSIDVIADITCKYGELDGFIRLNVSQGLTMVLRSNYIPVSIKNGETQSINLRSMCGEKAPIGEWKVKILYYDNNKRELGSVIINNVTFPSNGIFYVQEETGIETTGESLPRVTAGNAAISVENVAPNTVIGVYTLDGRQIYRGTNTTIATEKGIYLVTVEESGKEAVTIKAFVK